MILLTGQKSAMCVNFNFGIEFLGEYISRGICLETETFLVWRNLFYSHLSKCIHGEFDR